MSRLHQIETLASVGRHGSLAGAARELGVSSAAVSKQISKLEKELGIQLLVRTTRKLAFTDIGAAYLEQVHRIIEELEASKALVSQMKAIPCGKLRVFCTPHFASRIVVPNIAEFLNLYPKIELELEIGERIPHFEGEKIDVMMGNSMQAGSDLVHRRLLTTRYAICAAPSYLKRYGEPKHFNDLKDHRILTHRMRCPDNLLYFKDKKKVAFAPYIKVNDAKILVDLAFQGIGIVQLHHYTVKKYLQSGELQELFQNLSQDDVPIYVVLPPRKYTPRKVRALIDFIDEKLHSSDLSIRSCQRS
ncbi:LysR family transcriptional regulator [Waddlia chondrophila]|uniref:Putative transcriptional regulator n=1 Tax=Waddlia chondrophila (strain ATCC VR-1470 / WSU 86-1044) TaxID=716544 RepID=D6YUW6_WADCW|nr:LysR family transcriptional regulator [Waddlia chondrophila]ADI37927.1 putative transcriptional regulator [Waddlia chondrophila WSU 86-1044]